MLYVDRMLIDVKNIGNFGFVVVIGIKQNFRSNKKNLGTKMFWDAKKKKKGTSQCMRLSPLQGLGKSNICSLTPA